MDTRSNHDGIDDIAQFTRRRWLKHMFGLAMTSGLLSRATAFAQTAPATAPTTRPDPSADWANLDYDKRRMSATKLTVVRDIRYTDVHAERGVGDLFLSQGEPSGFPVLMIHGGGWNALTKESIEPFAKLFAAIGRTVFSINYRLLDHGPWPACLDDCIAAARYILDGKLGDHGQRTPTKILIVGASSGGHLAMMTGLALPGDRVEAIVSLAGPSMMDFPDGSSSAHLKSTAMRNKFFGTTEAPSKAQIDAISPAYCVTAGAPALYCIHSRNDQLVKISHSQKAVEAWQRVGAKGVLHAFNGPGNAHGLWDSEDRAVRQPVGDVVQALGEILRALQS